MGFTWRKWLSALPFVKEIQKTVSFEYVLDPALDLRMSRDGTESGGAINHKAPECPVCHNPYMFRKR